jgi:hypothetical protein
MKIYLALIVSAIGLALSAYSLGLRAGKREARPCPKESAPMIFEVPSELSLGKRPL